MSTALAPPAKLENKGNADPAGSGRLAYLDNLKTALVVGVISAHAATHFIGGGRWLNSGESVRAAITAVIGVAGLIGGLFWIGLFFLVAGFLTPGSLARSGPQRFLRDRLVRLGVPFAVYMIAVMPLLHYVEYLGSYSGKGVPDLPWVWFGGYVFPLEAGPLWFVADLLIFSTLYAVWWEIRRPRSHPAGTLRGRHLAVLAAIIAVASFAIHIVMPLYTRQYLDLHLSEWAQYIALFWFGTVCAEQGWFAALPDALWRRCGLAVLGAAVALLVAGVAGGALSGNIGPLTGGWHWQAAVTAGVEGTLAVAGSFWLLGLFRRWFDRQNAAARHLTRTSYAAYVVHQPVLVGAALGLDALNWAIEVQFLLLALATVLGSFAVAWLLVVRLRLGRGIL